jgi:L-alanine-DL-glutamate epimerase-like enolase superfamily enzyme
VSTDAAVERLVLRRTRIPLTSPYKLAFGVVEAFDTLLVEALLSDGRSGWGEATVLTGYTDETMESAWVRADAIAATLIDEGAHAAIDAAMTHHHDAPFTTTAFVTAIEMATGHELLTGAAEPAPLLAIVNASERGAIADEIEKRLADGYGTLKIKVGFDRRPDMERLTFIQDKVAGRAALRVDGNQGYDEADGVAFVAGIDPTDIELVEQPCAAGDWHAAVAVAKTAKPRGVPVMLDESIYGLDDVDRARDLQCADIIKLKLMKAGGLDALVEGLRHIRAAGMRPVLGNGVAGDIGCWMEARVAAREIDNAGEMNGFLKPRQRLFDVPMRLDRGRLVFDAAGEVRPDIDAIRSATLETKEYH